MAELSKLEQAQRAKLQKRLEGRPAIGGQALQDVGAPYFGESIPAAKFPDADIAYAARGWLQKACEAAGATVVGAGVGCGQSDIDIELDGHRFNVSIRPCA